MLFTSLNFNFCLFKKEKKFKMYKFFTIFFFKVKKLLISTGNYLIMYIFGV